MKLHEYIVGETYSMKAKDGDIIAKLVKIVTYPALGLPTDYIFEHISGSDNLVKASALPGKLFPIPGLFLEKIETKRIHHQSKEDQ